MRDQPDFTNETALYDSGHVRVAGVDEAGRGPLAGPVTAAAVWLDPAHIPEGLNDSKVLSSKRRVHLLDQILQNADVSVAHATVQEIDELNILRASHLAMRRAVMGLAEVPDHLIIDGNRAPSGLNQPYSTVVRGDAKVLSISAASIAAKVARDAIMAELALDYPGYDWEKNAGYPTRSHKKALLELGVTPHHRRSFRPVHNILYPENSVTG